MRYAQLQDLYDRFGQDEIQQLTDEDRNGTPDSERVESKLSDVDAEIDAALMKRYELPMDVVPRILVKIACDLVRAALYTDAPPKIVETNAATSRSMLRQISTGTMALDGALPAASAPNTSDARITHRRKRMRWPNGGGLC